VLHLQLALSALLVVICTRHKVTVGRQADGQAGRCNFVRVATKYASTAVAAADNGGV